MGNEESRPHRLLLDGGGELPPEAMEIFKGWAKEHYEGSGKPSALCTVLIIPWASERDLHEHLEDANRWIFEKDDIKINLEPGVAQITESSDVLETSLQLIDNANAVFFTGGDQSRIMDLLEARPKLHKALSRQFNDGVGFAGTSAGTAVMSGTMLTGDGGSEGGSVPWDFISRSRVVTRPGLGFAKNIVTDQHFTRRARFNRLLSVLLDETTPEMFGLGVEEDLAVVIEGDVNLRVFSSKPGLKAVLLKRKDDEPDETQPSRFELTLLPSNNGKVYVLE